MILVCTSDKSLVEACAGLESGRGETRQLMDLRRLESWPVTAEDLLIIDLKWFREDDLPQMTCPVMVLAEVPDFDQAMRLLRRGMRGYGNRHMQFENLQQAAAAVRAGQVWMPPAIISRMINTFSPAEPEPAPHPSLDQLSKREQEVAGLVARGLSNKELADKLYISVRTVKAHLTSIFSKTGFRDRLELAIRMKNN
jgi:DNA-binding NarL/FixJ family response regulator